MARLATRRTRTPDSEDEVESRAHTPLSTAPNDRKRARRQVQESDSPSTDGHQENAALTIPNPVERQPTLLNGQLVSGHQPGAIVRIKVTNFVTYTAAEFYPGPSLNMIIGPNGTGKSTFVCAICLGLGWPPHYLGRAKEPAEFVKHGCREATIEIEIQRKTSGPGTTRANPIITRIIRRDGNKSKWMVNGKDNTQKGVQSLCKTTFNIQLDNLCQFLPQDKVAEFAQMSPIDVLLSTQQAAGTPDMLQNQDHLKKLRSAQKELMQMNRGDREQLDSLERKQEMQRTEVERMREREVTKEKLGWLEQCRPVPQYGDAQKESNDAKRHQQELDAEANRLKAESAPILRKVNAKQGNQTLMGNTRNDMKRTFALAQQKYDAKLKTYTDLGTKCSDLHNNFEAETKSMKTKKEDRLKCTQRLGQLKQRRNGGRPAFDSRAMNESVKDRKDEIRNLKAKNAELNSRRSELGEQGRSRQTDIAELQKRLEGLDTQAGQQDSKLAATSRDTHEAWLWIQENQDLFEKKVYGPPLVECSLKDPQMARQVESLMQKSDFKIITVQSDKDFALLQQKLNREMGKYDISLRTCSESDLSRFRRPIPNEKLASYGLDCYVIDQLEGPLPVLAMLCNERFLHQSSLASRPITSEQHTALEDSELKSYVTSEQSYKFVRRAEYGKAGNMTSSKPISMPQFWTAQSVDVGRKAAVQRELTEKSGEFRLILEEHTRCKSDMADAEKKIKALEKEIVNITREKEEKQKQLMEFNSLPLKIQEEEAIGAGIDEWLAGVRDRQRAIVKERDETLLNQANAGLELEAALVECKAELSDLIRAEFLLIEATSDFESFRDQNIQVKERLEEVVKQEKVARIAAEQATTKARDLLSTVRQLSTQAQRAKNQGDSGLFDVLQTMTGAQGEGRWNNDRLEAEIESQKALLELTEGGSMDAVQQYEARGRSIEKLRSKLAEFHEKQEDLTKAIKEVRREWEPKLESLVGRISEAFSDSFARIGCAGQVTVHQASSDDPSDCTEENGGVENGLDFANWAIHISVKFRENEPLSLLDSHRQSGGERAVSTILYLMALQSLSRAPFRVVDEINQGMDVRNERMVHGRMVDVATGSDGGQYFLITPKLLTGLKYKRGMTVLCIVSGENVPGDKATYEDEDQNDVQVPKMDFLGFARRARELDLAERGGARWGDSGIGLMNRGESAELEWR